MHNVIEIRNGDETPDRRNACLRKTANRLAVTGIALLALFGAGYSQPKPDLVITDAKMTVQQENGSVKRADLTVKILNYCHQTQAVASGLAFFFTAPTAPGKYETLLITHRPIGPIKGGQTLTFVLTVNPNEQGALGNGDQLLKWLTEAQRLPMVRMVVDIPDKNKEANEDNNEYRMNPDKKPSQLSGQFQCSPKM